jgi:CxxC-x17-CxxC domain-containing protein
MEFTDQTLMCATCGQSFAFTVQEQEFYRGKGFRHTPKRCRDCRRAKRAMQSGNGNGAPSRRDNHNSSHAAHDPDQQPTLHEAVCHTCGSGVQLPFRPDGVRPVFCRPCFEERRRNTRG